MEKSSVLTESSPLPTPAWRPTLLTLYSASGLAIAAVVHFGSYLGTTIQPTNPLFFALHLGVFPAFGLCVFRSQRWQGKRRLFSESEPGHMEELMAYFPRWVFTVAALLFAYTFANFWLSFGHLSTNHGTPSPHEALMTVRAFSGHWLLFYAFPTLYSGFVPADAHPRDRVTAR